MRAEPPVTAGSGGGTEGRNDLSRAKSVERTQSVDGTSWGKEGHIEPIVSGNLL